MKGARFIAGCSSFRLVLALEAVNCKGADRQMTSSTCRPRFFFDSAAFLKFSSSVAARPSLSCNKALLYWAELSGGSEGTVPPDSSFRWQRRMSRLSR